MGNYFYFTWSWDHNKILYFYICFFSVFFLFILIFLFKRKRSFSFQRKTAVNDGHQLYHKPFEVGASKQIIRIRNLWSRYRPNVNVIYVHFSIRRRRSHRLQWCSFVLTLSLERWTGLVDRNRKTSVRVNNGCILPLLITELPRVVKNNFRQ